MTEPRPSVRSAKTGELAQRLAPEGRSIAAVIERALEAYEAGEVGRELAAAFYARLAAGAEDEDIDLEAILRKDQRPHAGPNL